MDLYCCGFNGFGQLQSNLSTEKFVLFKCDHHITDVAFSWNSLIIVTDNGTFISGFYGQEGGKLKRLSVPSNDKAVQVSCTSQQALFVTDVGGCWQYIYDNEKWKQLPNFTSVEGEATFIDDDDISGEVVGNFSTTDNLNVTQQVIRVCCGSVVNMALDDCGRTYNIPSHYTLKFKITDIACGFEHSLLLDERGVVFTCGSGTRGQLGNGEMEVVETPCEVDALKGMRVIKVAAGGWHSAVITESKDLYTWGWNNSGQLGFPTENDFKDREKCIIVRDISTSKDVQVTQSPGQSQELVTDELIERENAETSNKLKHAEEETLLEENSKKKIKLTTLCDANEGSGLDRFNDIKLPINSEKLKLIASDSCRGSKEDKTLSASLNRKEQENQVERPYDKIVTVLAIPMPVDIPMSTDSNVMDVSCGNRHTVILLDNGSVWGCGWNAYGQLGRPAHAMESTGRLVQLNLPFDPGFGKIVSVACGAWNTGLLVKRK